MNTTVQGRQYGENRIDYLDIYLDGKEVIRVLSSHYTVGAFTLGQQLSILYHEPYLDIQEKNRPMFVNVNHSRWPKYITCNQHN